MLLHAITIFLSAFLLFLVQPVIAKMILPWFGGASAVWATCLLFFQTVLLGGYLYAHGLVRWLKPKQQAMLHSILLVAAAALLPILPNPRWKPETPDAPIAGILGLLALTVGLPYFMLSTTGPLVQAWFARSQPGRSPYRLYALSNLGSMMALLCYPVMVEPHATLRQQAWLWSGAFIAFAVLCAVTGFRSRAEQGQQQLDDDPAPAPRWTAMAVWVALAACPSMLLLALTTHMSMDIAPIPFLWILPLTLYLLTLILAFDAPRWYARAWFLAAVPVAIGTLAWLVPQSPSDRPRLWLCLLLYSAAFFVLAMVCHGELARLKPHPKHLTGYYLMISLGGALGGCFVALVAPNVFRASYELPIALALVAGLATWVVFQEPAWPFCRDLLGWPAITALTVLAGMLGYLGREARDLTDGSMVVTRNFYGELRVNQYNGVYDWDGYRTLVHGAINHGQQFTHPARRREVATYYCNNCGLGLVMGARAIGQIQRVAVIGLGTGTIAGYSNVGDLYRFYEINPAVKKIANDDFWYLPLAEAAMDIVLGDARLSLEREPPQNYDIIALDAFSSDAIPVHLLTREAFELYFRHLRPDGVVAVHVSNRYLDLKPVVERVATSLGRRAFMVETEDNDETTCFGTTWVLVTSNDNMLARPEFQRAGRLIPPQTWLRIWTDDYSNLYDVLKLR